MQPDTDTLRRFVQGQLSADESAAVEGWLQDHPEALDTLQQLAGNDDTLINALRGNPAQEADSPSVEHLITRVAGLRDAEHSPPEAAAAVGMETEVGPLQLGGFRIGKLLGAGGMGQVYEAFDDRLERRVAVKIIHPQIAADPKAKARFLREARAAAAVEHDHIIPILQVGEANGCLYLAMPYLRGETLHDRLQRPEPLSLADVLKIGREVAAGLAAAHERGLVHRDIKPANLWLETLPDGGWRIKILDFGLARVEGHGGEALSEAGAILGTPAFMAPEQAHGDKVDARADLFSLGAVLYRLATGQQPFPGESTMSILVALAVDTPKPPCELNPDLPERLGRLITRLLAKAAEDRPASAVEVINELRAIEQEADRTEVIRPEPLPTPTPVQRRPARGPLVAIAVVIFVLLAGAALAAYKFVIDTPQGKLVVEISDPEIETRFKNGELLIYGADGKLRYTLKPNTRDGALPPGEYRIEVAGADGLRLISDEFTITKGNETIVRVRLEKPDAVVQNPPPAVVHPDAGKPFVLLRDGKSAGAFKTFAGVWADFKPGDAIVVHGNGPFPLGHVEVKERLLVLKAAAGFRPIFVPHATLFEKPDQPWFRLDRAGLDAEGCEFHMRGMPVSRPGAHPPPLTLKGGLPCTLRRCTLLGFSQLFRDFQSPSLTVEDCLFIGGIIANLYVGCEVRLTNNLLFSSWPLVQSWAPKGTEHKIYLTRNTLVACFAHSSLGFFLPENDTMTVIAEGNVVDFAGWKSWPVAKKVQAGVRWQGQGNAYANLHEGLAGWNASLAQPETDSREIPALPFGWRVDPPGELALAVPWWQERLAQTRRDTGLGDLGPDLSLVGPGAAWLRGLAADGKPVPKEQLRPEPLPRGPIVLLRQGKEARGFAKLDEAFAAAQDGDIIELRTDGEVAAAYPPENRGTITLRAAFGYRPVVSGAIWVQAGTTLALEGLTFSAKGCLVHNFQFRPFEKQGRISRMAYCTFETPRDPQEEGLFLALLVPVGGSTEIVRCFLPRRLEFYIPPDATVRIRESVLGPISYKAIDDKANVGALDLEACVLSHPKAKFNGRLFASLDYNRTTLRCVTRRCLFECATTLIDGNDRLASWSGTRNCFRLGRPWVGSSGMAGLTQWRAHSKSAEEGSVEGPSLIDDVNRWRLRGDQLPPGVGADVERIGRPAGSTTIPPTVGQPDAEKPFVLLRDGKPAGEFKSFASVWEQHKPDDEIVVHGNGPFPLGHVTVKDRALVLRAAPGFRPLFYPPESFFDKASVWIDLQQGSLTIEGCDVAMGGAPPGSEPPSLIGGEGPCALRNGRFIGFQNGLMHVYRGQSVTIEDSLLALGEAGLAHFPPRCQVTLTNNLIQCGMLFGFEKPGGQTVRLTRNAIVNSTGNGVHGGLVTPLKGATGVTMIAEGNLIDFSGSYSGTSQPLVSEGFRQRVRWQGKDNVYLALRGTIEQWNAQLAEPEVNSREVESLPFAWTLSQFRDSEPALAWWQDRLAQARRESNLADLGPNLALVGAGPAYLRSREADGRPVPKDQLRPEPLASGRIALIRAGKEERGYHQLQDAFNVARDGDILEIRTDAKLPGGVTPKDAGSLTLRAGAGYRPVISGASLSVSPGTALALEGVTFAADASLLTGWIPDAPLAKQGRVSRLVSCSFPPSRPGYDPTNCLILGSDGRPGEVTRCVVLGRLHHAAVEGVHVRFQECVFLHAICVWWPTGTFGKLQAAGTFEMDRCIAYLPRSVLYGALLGQYANDWKHGYRWTVRNSLLESASHLTRALPSDWTGEKNLIRIAYCWVGGGGGWGLAHWRGYKGIQETGSVEGEPWQFDPRSWVLPAGTVARGIGPDLSRIARPTGR